MKKVLALLLALVVCGAVIEAARNERGSVSFDEANSVVSMIYSDNWASVLAAIEAKPKITRYRFDSGETLLHRCASCDSPATTGLLIERGSDINATDSDGVTPLMIAAYSDRAENVKLLLERRAKVNMKDNEGNTALYYATYHTPDEDVIMALLQAGANY